MELIDVIIGLLDLPEPDIKFVISLLELSKTNTTTLNKLINILYYKTPFIVKDIKVNNENINMNQY
jgi:hypothetical protein